MNQSPARKRPSASRLLSMIALTILLTSCSGLPKLSLTPVDADLTVGGEHETEHSEESMVKVQTGDTSSTDYVADKVEQTYNEIQEYPPWLVIAFAISLGLAVPSPLSWWGNRRERKALEKQIQTLTRALTASQPTSTTKLEESLSEDSSR